MFLAGWRKHVLLAMVVGALGIVATASALAATTSLNGHVDFRDYHGDNWLLPVGVQFIQNGTVVRTERIFLDSKGNFSISGVNTGTYDLSFGACGFLRRVIPGVVFGSTPASITAALENGDLNGDNAVGLADLSILSASHGKEAQ